MRRKRLNIDGNAMRTLIKVDQDMATEWLHYTVKPDDLTARQFMQILCDLVRTAALFYQQPETELWRHFEQERVDPEVKERIIVTDEGVTFTDRSKKLLH